jgi:hypothetical protein
MDGPTLGVPGVVGEPGKVGVRPLGMGDGEEPICGQAGSTTASNKPDKARRAGFMAKLLQCTRKLQYASDSNAWLAIPCEARDCQFTFAPHQPLALCAAQKVLDFPAFDPKMGFVAAHKARHSQFHAPDRPH